MATKKATALRVVASPSKLKPGTGSRRVKTRFVVLYGPPKARKTTSASTLNTARTKWIVSDSNTLPTLAYLNRVPPDENIYEVTSVPEARAIVEEAIELAEKEGADALGVDSVVVDSATQFADWHQEDIAKMTGQRFMGENSKNNGWQQFNTEFGQFLDRLAMLARHVNVILICHSKEKVDFSKGEWAGVNLSPQMALKTGRLANCVFYQTCKDIVVDEKVKPDDFIQNIVENRDGSRSGKEVIINTQTTGLNIASSNISGLAAEEPGDLQKIFEKGGLL